MRKLSFPVLVAPAFLASILLVSCSIVTDLPPQETGGVPEGDAASSIASLICQLRFQCSCTLTPEDGSTEEECVETLSARYAEWQEQARAAGLAYDGACLARKLEQQEARGCQTIADFDRDPAQICAMQECSIYHGEVTSGQVCMPGGRYSECASGLSCFAEIGGDEINRCEKNCSRQYETVVGLGEACMDASMNQIAYCEKGTACHYLQGVCVTPDVQVGGSCANGYCVEGAYCKVGDMDDGVCAALLANGEACANARECASGGCDPSTGLCVALTPEICYSNDI
jgi:hypothetical protein